jgi:hypothetical protein
VSRVRIRKVPTGRESSTLQASADIAIRLGQFVYTLVNRRAQIEPCETVFRPKQNPG